MNTKLELTIKNTEQRCKLTDLDINVNITGFLSKTSVTMTFLNETDLDSEGELVFPMPEGAAISGYAVDINGDLVDGVVVEKEKARITFEAEARSVEKPSASIVEHVVGNVFRTRITPLPKKATRIIRVAYVEELTPSSKSQQNRSTNKNQRDVQWKMSLENIGPLNTLAMNAIIAGGGAPRGRFDGNTVGSIKPLPDVIGPVAWRFKSENCTIKQGFEIDVPGVASQIVEIDEDKQQYFVLNDDFSAEFNFNESVMQADRVALMWDASKSREVRSDKDIQLIKTYVQKLSNIVIDLIVFRDTPEELVTFKLVNGNASPLIDYLNKIPYIGGSNLGQLSVTKTVPVQIKDGEEIVIRDTYNYYLMFTDGLHNLSLNSTPEKLEAPVYIFSSSTLSDGTLLKVWARKSGGEYFDLNSTSSSTSEIVSKLGNTKFQYLFAEIDGAVVSEIYPSLPSPIQGKQFTIAGKINGQNPATIALNYGYGTRVTRRMKFQINPASALKNNLAARYWAQKKIDELQLFPEVSENESKILSIGQQYNIVTPNSSLIVLESLDQYVKYEIEPPKSLPEVRKNYLEIMKNRKQQQLERDNEKILSVVSFWQRRVAWWNEDVTSPEHSEPQIQHHFQFGFFKPDVYQVAPKDVLDLKQADLNDALKQKIVEDQEEEAKRKAEREQLEREMMEKLRKEMLLQEEKRKQEEAERRREIHEEEKRQRQEAEMKIQEEERMMIATRDAEIRLIEQEMKQVNEIYRDLSQLVNQQGLMIDHIESNVDSAQINSGWGEDDGIELLEDEIAQPEEASWSFDNGKYAEEPMFAADPSVHLLGLTSSSPSNGREYAKDEEKPRSEDEAIGAFGLFSDEDEDSSHEVNAPMGYAAPAKSMQMPLFDEEEEDGDYGGGLFAGDDDGEGGGGSYMPAVAAPSKPVLPISTLFAGEDKSYIDSAAFTASDSYGDLNDIVNQMDDGNRYLAPEPLFERNISKNAIKKKAKQEAVVQMKKEKEKEKDTKSNTKTNSSFVNKLFAGKREPEKPAAPIRLSDKKDSKPLTTETKSTTLMGKKKEESKARSSVTNAPVQMPPSLQQMAQPLSATSSQAMPPMQPSSFADMPSLSAAPKPYPSAAPSAYPSAPVLLAMPSDGQERFRSLSPRASALGRVAKISEESEMIARDTLDQLKTQKEMLEDIQFSISQSDYRPGQAVTELRKAEQYSQKKSFFGAIKNVVAAGAGVVGGKLSKQKEAPMPTTIPTIGFNSEPASEKRSRSRRNTRQNIAQIQKQVDEVKEVMSMNIDRVMDRGERIEDLINRSEDLTVQSKMFSRRAEKASFNGGFLIIILLPFIFLIKFVIWSFTRVKKILNNSVPEYGLLSSDYAGTTISNFVPPTRSTVTEPVYFTLTLPSVPAESPSDEYFGTLLKAQDEVQTQLNTAAAPEPESDTTVNKTEKVDPKTSWTNWHARQAQTWKEFEQKHFTTGLCFMQKWNEVRVGQLQRVLERELKRVDEEFNSTKTDLSFYKGDERKTASMEVLQKWKSREFYMSAIETLDNAVEENQIHAQILAIQKREHVHEKLSSFYIDAAQFLFGRGRIHEGATILSTLAEIDFENPQLLRAMAMNTDHIPKLDHMTEALYRQILKLRPDEPQSYTDLAAVLARRIFRTIKGNIATSTRDSKLLATANEAMDLYKQVIVKKWDVRWCQVELTALSEMSRLGHFVQWMGLDQSSMVNIDRRLVQSLMDLDLHVMIRWDTDLTDAEIVVTEPSGEVCNSFHNKTKTGMLSRNFTCGYGPQEYCVRTAQPGRYRIEVRLYGAPPAAPPTTVTVRVTTDWGRPVTQVEEYHVVRLSKVKEAVHVMDVNFKEL